MQMKISVRLFYPAFSRMALRTTPLHRSFPCSTLEAPPHRSFPLFNSWSQKHKNLTFASNKKRFGVGQAELIDPFATNLWNSSFPVSSLEKKEGKKKSLDSQIGNRRIRVCDNGGDSRTLSLGSIKEIGVMGRAGKVFSARKLGQMAKNLTRWGADTKNLGFHFEIDRSTANRGRCWTIFEKGRVFDRSSTLNNGVSFHQKPKEKRKRRLCTGLI